MKVLFDSFVILQIECQNVVLNKHRIISKIKKASLIFQNSTRGKYFGISQSFLSYELIKKGLFSIVSWGHM
jgi:hypothetical protein